MSIFITKSAILCILCLYCSYISKIRTQINSTKTIGNTCLTSVPLSRNNFISKGGVTYTKKAKLPNNKLCGYI